MKKQHGHEAFYLCLAVLLLAALPLIFDSLIVLAIGLALAILLAILLLLAVKLNIVSKDEIRGFFRR